MLFRDLITCLFFPPAIPSMLWHGHHLEPMWSVWTKEIRRCCGLNFNLKVQNTSLPKQCMGRQSVCLSREERSPISGSHPSLFAECISLPLAKNYWCIHQEEKWILITVCCCYLTFVKVWVWNWSFLKCTICTLKSFLHQIAAVLKQYSMAFHC